MPKPKKRSDSLPHQIRSFKAALAAGNVKRWHTRYVIQQETVGAHSWVVGMLVQFLYDVAYPNEWTPAEKLEMLNKALIHDIGELRTGDLPAHVKRLMMPYTLASIECIEEDFVKAAMMWRTKHLVKNALQVKKMDKLIYMADVLAAAYYCGVERSLGNNNLSDVAERLTAYLKSMNPRIVVMNLCATLLEKPYAD